MQCRNGSSFAYQGYTRRVPYGEYDEDEERGLRTNCTLAKVGHEPEGMRLTHDDMVARGHAVEAGERKASDVGAKGTAPIVKQLSYVHAVNIWTLPVAHALLYGIVKDFWNRVLATVPRGQERPWYVMPQAMRAIMRKRASKVVMTVDFNRPYRDIVDRRGNWVMEDWAHFAETFSVYILKPHSSLGDILHDARLRSMWAHLRPVVVHCMRGPDQEHLQALAEGNEDCNSREVALRASHVACDHLLRYAKLVEAHFPSAACTYNLHVLACRLKHQEVERGLVYHELEFWVERLIQFAKRTTKFKTTTAPELLLVGRIELERALVAAKREFPDLCSFDEFVPEYRAGDMHAKNLDNDEDDNVQLLGSGQSVQQDTHLADVGALVSQLVKDFPQDNGWDEAGMGLCPEMEVFTYQHAHLRCKELVQSRSYLRSRLRESFWVLVRYEEGPTATEVSYVAEILQWYKVISVDQDLPILRFACARLYKCQVQSNSVVGKYYEVQNMAVPDVVSYPVLPASMDSKLVCCKGDVQQPANLSRGTFLPYRNYVPSNDVEMD